MKLENIGLGVDMERISRFEKYGDFNCTFVQKIFTKKEIEYCYKNKMFAQHLCARFCAKEACIKALSSLGVSGYFCHDFEIENIESGAPKVNVLRPKKGDNFSFKVSLSHSGEYATATVIACIN